MKKVYVRMLEGGNYRIRYAKDPIEIDTIQIENSIAKHGLVSVSDNIHRHLRVQ